MWSRSTSAQWPPLESFSVGFPLSPEKFTSNSLDPQPRCTYNVHVPLIPQKQETAALGYTIGVISGQTKQRESLPADHKQ